jgi:hypothetical protein
MRTTCNGNKQCAFALNNEHCGGDPKPGRGKTGILAYTCDTPESKGLDSKPVCTLGESCSFTTFENLGEVIRCESGVLSVQGVKYGFGLATSECSNYLKSYCNGWTNCNVTLSNANCGGDPAYGRVKSGEITYSCVPPGSVSRSQSEATGTQICTASTCSQTATEGVSSRMVCDTGLISIKAASYGVDSVTRDCSAGLRTSCEGQKDCSYMVSNLACGGDPVPNVVKQGQVSYTCQ